MKKTTGFTLIEMLVVISIIAILSTLTFMNVVAQQEKQNLTNSVYQLQTALDTARTKAIAVSSDASGLPSSWGVYLHTLSSGRDAFTIGPYDVTSFTPNPQGSQTTPLKKSQLFSNNSQDLLIIFDKLTGQPQVFRPPQNPYGNWLPELNIMIQTPHWKQSVLMNALGTTSLSPLQP